VIEGERKFSHLSHGQFTVHHPRPAKYPTYAKNSDFGMITDCRRTIHSEDTVVVERERPAPQLCRRGFAFADHVGQSADLGIQFAGAELFGPADGRDGFPAVGPLQ
jgi:hypothetical protein